MSGSSVTAVVCFEGSRLSAIQTETSRTGAVSVKAAFCKAVTGLTDENPAKASAEIKKILNADGFAKAVRLAVPRHEVVVKQLTVRCGELDDADLMPMVRLALGRENTVDLPNVVIDYVVVSRENQNATVLVTAMDKGRLERLRALLAGAGRKATSVRVRTDGLASFAPSPEPTLIIAPGPSGCEFAVVRDGVAVSSRASQDTVTPEQIRVEADRTLFSTRMTSAAPTTDNPVLVSSSASEFPENWTHAPTPPAHASLGKGLQNVHLPLLGLAVEEPGPHRVDLQNPQKPADRGAPARQKAMLVAFVLIAMVGTSWVLGNNKTRQLDAAITAASAARDTAFKNYVTTLVDQARFEHEAEWAKAKVDWSSHVEALIAALPAPGDVTLNEISGRAESEVVFTAGGSSTLPGKWDVQHRVRLDLNGSAKDRATIEALRATLLSREGSTLTINGADTADEFSLQLNTPLASPKEAGK